MDILVNSIGGIGQLSASIDLAPAALSHSVAPGKDLALQFSTQLERTDAPATKERLAEHSDAAKKFEAIVVAQMLTSILPKDSEYFGDGFAGDAWRSMMSEQLANVVVEQTDFGIASLIEQELAAKTDSR